MPEQPSPARKQKSEVLGPHHVQTESWIDCAPFESLLGIEIREAAGGEAVLKMPFIRQLSQGFGLMHGGALTSLADTSVVMAIKSVLPKESKFATTRIEVDFLKPVKSGVVTAIARIIRRDGQDLYCISEIIDDRGDKVLKCECRFRVARDVSIDSLPGIPASSQG